MFCSAVIYIAGAWVKKKRYQIFVRVDSDYKMTGKSILRTVRLITCSWYAVVSMLANM